MYLLLFSLAVLIPIILLVPQFKEDLLVYILMCLMLIGQTLFPEWFFRDIEKMGYITALNLIVKLSFTIGVFVSIKAPQDYWLYPFLLGASYIIVAFISHYIIIRKFNLKLIFVGIKRVEKTLKIGFPLFVNQFVPTLFNNTTNFLVGMILGKTSAGYFGATRQVVQLLTVFNSVVSSVAFSYLIRYKEKFDIFSKYYLILIAAISLFLVLVHQYIFDIIGIEYNFDSEVFYILIAGFLAIVFYSVYSTNYLISKGYDKVVMRITIIASVIGFVLSFPLIYKFVLLGGATNIFISQLILGFGSYFYFKKINKEMKYES